SGGTLVSAPSCSEGVAMANARAVATAIADLVVLAEPRLAGVKYALALVVALTDRSADQLREVSDHLERQTGASLATGLMQLSDASDLENERARERQLEHATDTPYAAWIDVSEVRKHPR